MKQQAFQTASITESITAFAQFLRSHGFNAGIQETNDALLTAQTGLLENRRLFKYGLKAIFCHSPEERQLFEKLFLLFWDTNPTDLSGMKYETRVQGITEKKTNRRLIMLGQGKTAEEPDAAKNVSGANEAERLQKVDFSKIKPADAEELEKLAEKFFREMPARLRRKMKENRKNGPVSLRKTIRSSIATGGEPAELRRKFKKPKKRRLTVLLDVSGSMDKYSFYLLRFICALREHFRQTEAFIFSTSLICISKALLHSRPESILAAIAQQTNNWNGGTRIGGCLRQFNEKYGKRILNAQPFVIILSDGLDTGTPEVLSAELENIRRRAKKVIWLNPLKGMAGYQPAARGMSAALPLIDDFRTAHNLSSLLELENILAHA